MRMIQGFEGRQPLQHFLQKAQIQQVVDQVHLNQPLHLAVMYCNSEEIFLEMLRMGADVQAVNRTGDTPLTLAMRYNRTSFWHSMVKLLREKDTKLRTLEQENVKMSQELDSLRKRETVSRRKLEAIEAKHAELEISFANLGSALRTKKRRLE